MGHEFFSTLSGIVGLFVAVALTSVIVSKKAQTPQVIQATGSAIGNNLAVAEAPVTGANTPITLAYPSDSPFSGSPYMS
jgi:hypothetical protein